MGNTGKPSRACATCKKRKIKCDQLTPACSQCKKAGWVCPGVPSEADINFRNQTSIVRKNTTQGRSTLARGMSSKSNSALGARTRSLSPPAIDRATSFFIHQYVLILESGSSSASLRGNHEYLPGLLQNEHSASGVLNTVIAAAGLAAMSNAGSVLAWRSEAFRLYGKAIRQLQDVLQDPIQRKSDQTLAAVMLMGTFETIASADITSMKTFSHHTIAAARCIEMRGPDQFHSEASLKLFYQMRRIIVMTCHQLQEPIPHALTRWSRWAEYLHSNDLAPANRFTEINERLAGVRAEIKHQDIRDPAIVAARLLPIDELFESWAQTLPPSWTYKSYRYIGPNGVPSSRYDLQYDTYPDTWVACLWNSYRNVRLLIHESIMAATLKYGTDEQKANLHRSAKVLVNMANGICHSAAYLLGYRRHDGNAEDARKFEGLENVPTPGGGFLLLWPLFFSGMLRTTPKEQRQWVAKKIHRMAVQMGLQLAMSMAKLLEEKALSFSHSDTFFLGEWHPN
ncbi:hypothetical protein B0J13DRAFT_559658 [Dactylonectria estremocensis]|uniref:Zn(2)-C6 fungal-type domain-containing protein n=1 Tax=Dactylonectria estremocensis TaxID=1079267 RepID=A0A9P9EH89_9HYPO|nr:hypothetical protein B0J13DRAFT_559658 [Dactylonectria estremocensis]